MPRIVAPLSDAERAAYVAACASLMTAGPKGGPVLYKHGGRSLRGLDCIGVPIYGLAQVDRQVEDLRAYSPRPDGRTLETVLRAHLGDPLPKGDPWEPGDIPLMRWHQADGVTYFCHVGVLLPERYTGGGVMLIHALKANGTVITNRFSGPGARDALRALLVFRP